MNGYQRLGFLKELEANIRLLPVSPEVWDLACELAQKCRFEGTPIPTTDIVIEACARVHQVGLEQVEKHFEIRKFTCGNFFAPETLR